MKFVFAILFLFLSSQVSGQNHYIGEWNDYFGNSFDINEDSTFKYKWQFDLIQKWANGTWAIHNDTIYFNFVPVYDTLRYSKSYGLELSDDEIPSVSITSRIAEYTVGGQDTFRMPKKLFYRSDKLYIITSNGKLIKKKRKGWTGKWPEWYIRRDKYYK